VKQPKARQARSSLSLGLLPQEAQAAFALLWATAPARAARSLFLEVHLQRVSAVMCRCPAVLA
jgi:hypothetical protein